MLPLCLGCLGMEQKDRPCPKNLQCEMKKGDEYKKMWDFKEMRQY